MLALSFHGVGVEMGLCDPEPVAPMEWNGESLLAPSFMERGADDPEPRGPPWSGMGTLCWRRLSRSGG